MPMGNVRSIANNAAALLERRYGFDDAPIPGRSRPTVVLRRSGERGATLSEPDHHLVALWATSCAEPALNLFLLVRPQDPRVTCRDRADSCLGAWSGDDDAASRGSRPCDGCGLRPARVARHATYAAGQAGLSRIRRRTRTRRGRDYAINAARCLPTGHGHRRDPQNNTPCGVAAD